MIIFPGDFRNKPSLENTFFSEKQLETFDRQVGSEGLEEAGPGRVYSGCGSIWGPVRVQFGSRGI